MFHDGYSLQGFLGQKIFLWKDKSCILTFHTRVLPVLEENLNFVWCEVILIISKLAWVWAPILEHHILKNMALQ